ncbi:hypothetical protein [Paenibacillus thermotolerans]|uniref:hypothetical protein n=1 Tax=Paenibacillus thermotolerans TaxID=3027807 RepID=UPI002367CE5E|nr:MULTISPECIES: hypothetical protein [unclassified Paenibacillus]
MNETGRRAAKKVAVIVTEYRFNSHADVILGRLLGDFSYEPKVQVVSIYTDQAPPEDMSREAARRLGIPIYPTIRDTIRAEHCPEPIDGVVIIGEHGNYPNNEKGQTLYPRRRFLEETLLALDELGLAVPIFSDKHFSYDYREAVWMYNELKRRNIPFMGGSSIPHTEHVPAYDLRKLRTLKEVLVISHSTLVEAYGFHALEVLQWAAERRNGGETGVRTVSVTKGEAVWSAMDRGEWPEDLMLQALSVYPGLPSVHPREIEPGPILMFIEYEDGTKGYIVQFKSLVEQWGYAFRSVDGEVVAALCNSQLDRPFDHFERLTRMIEEMIVTHKQPFPIERTLLTTGLTCAVVDSFHYGQTIETPELSIVYGAGSE